MCTVLRHTIKSIPKVEDSICVGILTLPHSRKQSRKHSHTYSRKMKHGHIMKSYVDWFESQGVKVVPVPYDTIHHEAYFHMINGLFIPGTDKGFDVMNKTLVKTVTRFFELSLQPGEYFPIWGTCFGFQLLTMLVSGNTTLQRYEADGRFPIHITKDGKRSRMMHGFSKPYRSYLENSPSTLQYHDYGISPTDFLANAHLRRFYRILATALDHQGCEYVAAIEGKYYPIYGVQGHPERQKRSAPFLSFFLSELQKNTHRANVPFMRSIYSAEKCVHDKERNELCYFF